MIAIARLALRALLVPVRDDAGLMRTERALLAGALAMALAAALLLLGVDIMAWFGVEPPPTGEEGS